MDRLLKCSECRKKVGLFKFTCRCERTFCTACRIPKSANLECSGGHVCTFDYKLHGKEQFEKNNPKLTTTKIDVI